ncbi:hypothetical protein FA143_28940, partial [Pseudomonas aeruginosa]|nr:hypothetical protein [Pseudomonas aeruginosa]
FGIRHRGSTVPERSGVALSFCRRLASGRVPNTQRVFFRITAPFDNIYNTTREQITPTQL